MKPSSKNHATSAAFDQEKVLHELRHYLPAQAPLKDFVHHNTLHSFQHLRFFEALHQAAHSFGYDTRLKLKEFRKLYKSGKIREDVISHLLQRHFPGDDLALWYSRLLEKNYPEDFYPNIGQLRIHWKKSAGIDLNSMVHPLLFRLLCNYLDQGIAIWSFPEHEKGLLASVRVLERNTYSSFFKTKEARKLLVSGDFSIESLLERLVGNKAWFERYLFDQQFAHPGWSGMVATIEDHPHTLLDLRKVNLHDLICLELLLELDACIAHQGNDFKPLATYVSEPPKPLFSVPEAGELDKVISIFQEALEWSYYDEVLAGIEINMKEHEPESTTTFQAMFCIDDRECSLRRHIEQLDPQCKTYGTPGFFGVEFYFQPKGGKFYTKLCPAPVKPGFLIKETSGDPDDRKDAHFRKGTHGLLGGWLISQTLGFWSAMRLFWNIIRPGISPATASSLRHMNRVAELSIEHTHDSMRENGLQIGFSVPEMADRVEKLFRSIGLVKDFAQLVYVVGHGASSVNNPHYSAYDCGACSGRPGSVNARVFSYMANHPEVRKMLAQRGIQIPQETRFISGLHDTTRDDIVFYDEEGLPNSLLKPHLKNVEVFLEALDQNAKERSRRLELVESHQSPEAIHEKMRRRSVSLFEPRPELNHATNALCIVGRRELSKHLFLDRRSFLNSYDWQIDDSGDALYSILKAAAPVCGGINLEYYFSRVDNSKLGAGSKLPHNVMGLIGVANGADGDLRPGLPSQMIEVHDPLRLLIIVEAPKERVNEVIRRDESTYEWFRNEWVNLVVRDPRTGRFFHYRNEAFEPYQILKPRVARVDNLENLFEEASENLPVYLIP